MTKFILTVPRYSQDNNFPHVRISQEAYTVLSEMCAKTGWPMSRILSKAVFFAAENLSIETEDKKED
jgi:hypothetical protein